MQHAVLLQLPLAQSEFTFTELDVFLELGLGKRKALTVECELFGRVLLVVERAASAPGCDLL